MDAVKKSTPGPWEAKKTELGYGQHNGVQVRDVRHGLVVAVAINDVPELSAHANARLMAAAPDLRAALDASNAQMRIWIAANGDMVGALAQQIAVNEAALAKAESTQ